MMESAHVMDCMKALDPVLALLGDPGHTKQSLIRIMVNS